MLRASRDLLGEGLLSRAWREHRAPTVALEERVAGGGEVLGGPHLRGAEGRADHDGDQRGVRVQPRRLEATLDRGPGRRGCRCLGRV